MLVDYPKMNAFLGVDCNILLFFDLLCILYQYVLFFCVYPFCDHMSFFIYILHSLLEFSHFLLLLYFLLFFLLLFIHSFFLFFTFYMLLFWWWIHYIFNFFILFFFTFYNIYNRQKFILLIISFFITGLV